MLIGAHLVNEDYTNRSRANDASSEAIDIEWRGQAGASEAKEPRIRAKRGPRHALPVVAVATEKTKAIGISQAVVNGVVIRVVVERRLWQELLY